MEETPQEVKDIFKELETLTINKENSEIWINKLISIIKKYNEENYSNKLIKMIFNNSNGKPRNSIEAVTILQNKMKTKHPPI